MTKIPTPIVMVNFKTYEQSVNTNALALAKICDSLSSVAICVSALDVAPIAAAVSIPVLAQHVDGYDYGSHTGKILPEMLRSAGACGSLINHSEDRVDLEQIKVAVLDCKKDEIISVVCVKDVVEAKEVAAFSPDFIAIEPPELIGGDISVTSANPDIVKDSVTAVNEVNSNIPVLCGAGVKSKEDVAAALALGAKGVLVASGVVKSDDPLKALEDLVAGLG